MKSTEERFRICAQHVAFMYVQGEFANNKTLRKRFGVGESKANIITKLISLAKEKRIIKDFDPKSNSRKYIKYVPTWA